MFDFIVTNIFIHATVDHAKRLADAKTKYNDEYKKFEDYVNKMTDFKCTLTDAENSYYTRMAEYINANHKTADDYLKNDHSELKSESVYDEEKANQLEKRIKDLVKNNSVIEKVLKRMEINHKEKQFKERVVFFTALSCMVTFITALGAIAWAICSNKKTESATTKSSLDE